MLSEAVDGVLWPVLAPRGSRPKVQAEPLDPLPVGQGPLDVDGEAQAASHAPARPGLLPRGRVQPVEQLSLPRCHEELMVLDGWLRGTRAGGGSPGKLL